MERFKLVRREENALVFESANDLETAYELLKNGSEVLISWSKEGKIVSEIVSPSLVSDIVDNKFEFKSEEVRK